MPVDLFLLCLVKKLTVMGIIGKTHGVNKAAKPLMNDSKKINNRDLSEDFLLEITTCSFDEHPLTLISKSSSYGGKQ